MLIHFILLITSFTVFTHAHENVTTQHVSTIIHESLAFNNTGRIISLTYKEYVTLPKDAWCIVEDFIFEDRIKIKDMKYRSIYYENEKNVIRIYWDTALEKKEKIIQDRSVLRMLFYIRTFYSLTNGSLKTYIDHTHKYFSDSPEKKLKDFVYKETLDHTRFYIFNQRIPNEILSNIATYTDYKSLFCVLSCVNKTFYAFVNQLNQYCNIKNQIKDDTFQFTQMIKTILFRSNSLPLVHKKIPLDIIINDPRFSRKAFFNLDKLSFEKYLWKSQLKIHKINDVYYLYEITDPKDTESNNRTDEEFDELLHACSSNTEQFSAEIFRKKDAQKIAKKIKEIVYNTYNADKAYRSVLKDKNVLFIHLWNELYQTCINEPNQNMDLKNFYDRSHLFTILVELLYKDLDAKKIGFDQIPFTFLECIRDIAKPLYNVPFRDLTIGKWSLMYTLKENPIYCYKIMQDPTILDHFYFSYTLNNGIILDGRIILNDKIVLELGKKLDETIFFIDIWNQIYNKVYQNIINASDTHLKNYYNNPSLFAILVRLLYNNLDAKIITLDQIPSSFLECIRDIAKPLSNVPIKNLLTYEWYLMNTLEKNKMYFYKIVYDTYQPLTTVVDYSAASSATQHNRPYKKNTVHQCVTDLSQDPLLRIFAYAYSTYYIIKVRLVTLFTAMLCNLHL